MTASDLDTELRRSAEKTAESILGTARAEAERLTAEADQRIESRRSAVRRDQEAARGSEARVAIAAVRHTAMGSVLLARTRLVDRVLERARSLLPDAAQTEAYRSTLGSELAEALQFVDVDGAVVRCTAGLTDAVHDALRGRPEVSIEPNTEIGTGFIVVGAGKSVLVDGCLETRLDRLASALAIRILAQIEEL
jgi:vacuolar-type H+-ATPase subunit E/Vma4